MRRLYTALVGLLVLSAGCLSGAQDVATRFQESPPGEPENEIEAPAAAYIENATTLMESYNDAMEEVERISSGYSMGHMEKEEARDALKPILWGVGNKTTAWNDTQPYNASFERFHEDIYLAGALYVTSIGYLSLCIRDDDQDYCDESADGIEKAGQYLEDARKELEYLLS